MKYLFEYIDCSQRNQAGVWSCDFMLPRGGDLFHPFFPRAEGCGFSGVFHYVGDAIF